MSLAILFHFLYAQNVSDINISIINILRLFCCITTLGVFFLVRCVLEIWCGWVGVVFVLQASVTIQSQCRTAAVGMLRVESECHTAAVGMLTIQSQCHTAAFGMLTVQSQCHTAAVGMLRVQSQYHTAAVGMLTVQSQCHTAAVEMLTV